MTDKEFRRLSRADLVEIIYQLQQSELKLQTENQALRQQLASKELKISEYGSIAEAVIGLSGIFETAQAAADRYLREIQSANANAEEILAKAQQQADAMIVQAQRECDILHARSDREIQEKLNALRAKTELQSNTAPDYAEESKVTGEEIHE